LFKFRVEIVYLCHIELDLGYCYDDKQDANTGKIDTSKANDVDDEYLETLDFDESLDFAKYRVHGELKAIVSKLKLRDSEDCGRRHAAVLLKQIPIFGADFAAHDLRSPVNGKEEK
jgi:hypothetical protein